MTEISCKQHRAEFEYAAEAARGARKCDRTDLRYLREIIGARVIATRPADLSIMNQNGFPPTDRVVQTKAATTRGRNRVKRVKGEP